MAQSKINTRVDLPTEQGAAFTANALSVYFYYLVNSKRNPTKTEYYRYVYCKDLPKTQIAKDLNISSKTVLRAEQELIKANYLLKDETNRIIYIPDATRYVWLPTASLEFFIRLAKNGIEDIGLLSRLYAILYYCRKEDQEFCARTWVHAFNMSETNSCSYWRVSKCLYALEYFGLITYDTKIIQSIGKKSYRWYFNVRVAEDGIPADTVEDGAVGKFADTYSQLVETFLVDPATGEAMS